LNSTALVPIAQPRAVIDGPSPIVGCDSEPRFGLVGGSWAVEVRPLAVRTGAEGRRPAGSPRRDHRPARARQDSVRVVRRQDDRGTAWSLVVLQMRQKNTQPGGVRRKILQWSSDPQQS